MNNNCFGPYLYLEIAAAHSINPVGLWGYFRPSIEEQLYNRVRRNTMGRQFYLEPAVWELRRVTR